MAHFLAESATALCACIYQTFLELILMTRMKGSFKYIAGKEENAGYHCFLLFSPKCFLLYQPFPNQALGLTCLKYKSFENTVGKGEIAHNSTDMRKQGNTI